MNGSTPLPPGWTLSALAELIREPLRNGHSARRSLTGKGVRTLTLTAVTEGDFSERNTKVTTADPAAVDDLWLEPGDVLVERSNTPELVGTARMFRGPHRYAIFPDLLIRVRTRADYSPKLLEAFLSAPQSRRRLRAAARGIAGSMPKISQPDLESLVLPVPPPAEQQEIVATLDELFSRLDAAEASLRRARANLRRYRASILQAAVTGRLVPTEAELARREGRDYEPAGVLLERILVERRRRWEETELARLRAQGKGPKDDRWKERYPEPVAPAVEELPELPEGWCWTTLDAIAEVVGGLPKGAKRQLDSRVRSVPYLRVANVQRGFLDLADVKTIAATKEEIAALRLQARDVLFNEGGDRDKLGRGWVWDGQIAECIHQNHVFRARLQSDSLDPRYISHYGNSEGQRYFFLGAKQTTNLASLNMTTLRNLPIALPPSLEQARITTEAERATSILDRFSSTLALGLARAAVLRRAILAAAFRGQFTLDPGAIQAADSLRSTTHEKGSHTC